ncbi:RNA polymerase sigma factor SigX [Bacillus sp. GM2]|uniref:RNA polymerase sigma factor n=6 Tax=Bacillus TaxID=1386 RepID=Q65HY8_BACLD|nr:MULTISPECIES: RNA polymerase sigma factor SigX [Bacillus]KUL06114.1 RNA polymerase sigma factor SigX [Bacillus licheniformis LMG 7559]KUL15746.1 RNA polymerase sigma factor SigX [Bacillus licheniformis LMG 6934]MBJ7888449.1 RNA polymerase sigma factor SigX [Bacillaceae bacterium HSR45]MBY8347019.1 RNA polymerase sigma factor SigX [Bacillus sp. PCH94]MCJ2147942.1 RNA polymerase sigma factor SigX [Bacillus sp. B19-2]MDP4079522.1 RNA polymerase sigma factor SigX [Bacillota bacterium]NBB45225
MEETFQKIYDQYHQDLFQFLFYMVKDKNQAEDLVQEVYIRVLHSYETFEGRSSEKTWLLSIARHVAIDWFRKQQTIRQRILGTFDWEKQDVKDRKPLPEDIVMQNENLKEIFEALDKCTLDQRSVIVLRFIQGYSISETAKALNFSESKVKTTQHRGLKVLRKQMELLKEDPKNEEVRMERRTAEGVTKPTSNG